MKKILCLIDTLSFGGGAERQMAGLAGLLYQYGYNVTLATYHCHKSDDIIFKRYGMKSVLIECGTNFVSKFLAVRNFISNDNFDTVIAYKDGPAMIACLCKMLGGKFKLIVSERNTTQRITSREIIKFHLYRYAQAVVPNSYSQGKYIINSFPRLASIVHVITNFTDTNLFHPDMEYRYNEGKTNILVVARINPQKNVERFIKVACRLKHNSEAIHIDWYGGVNARLVKYNEKIKSLYENANISDHMTFKGIISNISEIYKKYDAVCLPSLFEGFPNAICEAMSCGKPILCSNICDNPRIVKDGENGLLFNPLDENDIYSKLVTFSHFSTYQKSKMGNKSRKIAVNLLSERTFVDKYINLINSI